MTLYFRDERGIDFLRTCLELSQEPNFSFSFPAGLQGSIPVYAQKGPHWDPRYIHDLRTLEQIIHLPHDLLLHFWQHMRIDISRDSNQAIPYRYFVASGNSASLLFC